MDPYRAPRSECDFDSCSSRELLGVFAERVGFLCLVSLPGVLTLGWTLYLLAGLD